VLAHFVIYAIRYSDRVDVFEAVAEPNRRALLDRLAEGERTAGELGAGLPDLTQPAVSRHLRVLRDAGLVDVRAEAQRRIYALRPGGLDALDAWLSRYRRYWVDHLDALERQLDAGAAAPPETEGRRTPDGERMKEKA
jgi:DNA-binding transcriptional ArsR family regulator